jgi:hypothetical protein
MRVAGSGDGKHRTEAASWPNQVRKRVAIEDVEEGITRTLHGAACHAAAPYDARPLYFL